MVSRSIEINQTQVTQSEPYELCSLGNIEYDGIHLFELRVASHGRQISGEWMLDVSVPGVVTCLAPKRSGSREAS